MNPLIIKNWKDGIADSPHEGIGLMRMADIESFPGAVKVRPATTTLFHAAYTSTFTADAGTDIMTSSATVPITGIAVTVSNSGGALPTGLSASTNYFIINVSSTTFKLATTLANAFAGTAIDITGAGSGTNTIVTVNPGTITYILKDIRDNSSVKYFQDSNARVWFRSSTGTGTFLLNGNTLTNGNGNGMVLFRPSDNNSTYLFAFRNASIDVVNVFSATERNNPSWSNAWQALNTSSSVNNSHHTILGQDNLIYFCDGRFVGSILENPGSVFAPGTGASYTYNNQALDLPLTEVAQCLEELGTNLLIGGNNTSNIYPWDRTSDSFSIPLQVAEVGIKRMKNIGGQVYILAGSNGNVYKTQGTYVDLFRTLPEQMVNNSSTLQETIVTWGGIAARNGALLFGAAGLTSANSGAYLLYPDGRLVMDNIPSTGAGNATAILADSEYYTLGYASGADVVGTTRYAAFNTVVQSGLYPVATKTEKAKFSTLEVQVADPATTGNIRVSYRRDTTGSFTTLATFTADSSSTSFRDAEIGITDVENIEVQVEMDGNFQLKEVRLIP